MIMSDLCLRVAKSCTQKENNREHIFFSNVHNTHVSIDNLLGQRENMNFTR